MFPSSDDSTQQLIFGTDLRSGRNNSFGMATRYYLDGLGFESHWRWDFPCRPDWSWGPSNLPHSNKWVSIRGVKRPRRGVNYPPTSRAEVKERVELYIYFPSGPSWHAVEGNLFYLTYLRNYTASFPRWQYLNMKCWDNPKFHTANTWHWAERSTVFCW
jgi:hypothetical protein